MTMPTMQGILLLLLLNVLSNTASAHQSIAYPTPISHLLDCRVGNRRNCPGPCPNIYRRRDQDPRNPKVTVRRGSLLGVKTRKNNHVGGFVRWSIVKLRHMNSHYKHKRGAFYYTCADHRLSRCSYREREYCNRDGKNEYYQHYLRIPNIYSDGLYVLGFAWYGGLVREGTIGLFGDYYDCMYIRIRGGAVKGYHKPTFYPWHSLTGRRGMCKASVNRLGVCRVEPCRGSGPGGYREAKFMIPSEFTKRGGPKGLLRRDFK